MSLLRRLARYTRRDLREIIAPTSLPDPAPAAGEGGGADDRDGDGRSAFARAWAGSTAYFDTWRRPKPEEDDGAAVEEAGAPPFELTDGHRRAATVAVAAARGAADGARPVLRALYETRVTAYRDAVGRFAEGYREGLGGGGGGGAVPTLPDAAAAAPAPPKRKRGRPRKHPLPPEKGG